jgi:hypothetical protein
VNIVIWGGLVIRGPRYELHLTSFWKCLACADFIKDLIWRVQLLNANVFFSCSLWKILLFIPYGIFQVWYLLCFQCNVPSHRWKIKAQMKRSQMKSHRWRDHRWRVTDKDWMKDSQKSWFQNIWHWQVKIKKNSFHNKCIKKKYQN